MWGGHLLGLADAKHQVGRGGWGFGWGGAGWVDTLQRQCEDTQCQVGCWAGGGLDEMQSCRTDSVCVRRRSTVGKR